MGVWPCGRVGVSGGGMNDAIGSKNTYKPFLTRFFDCIPIRVCRLDPPVGILSKKSFGQKSPVSTV